MLIMIFALHRALMNMTVWTDVPPFKNVRQDAFH